MVLRNHLPYEMEAVSRNGQLSVQFHRSKSAMPETQIVLPLDCDEIKSGIVTKIAESIWDALNNTCNLYGVAYPKFKAKFVIDLNLDNFGDVRLDVVAGETESEGEFHNPHQIQIEGEIPFTPPNVFRKQTGQSIPVIVENDDGSVEQKAIFYRKERERGPKVGRANGDEDI